MKDPRVNTKDMLDLAIKNKVRYHFGEKFSIANDANRYLRLSFSWYDINGIIKGVQRLRQTIEETIKELN
jgi:DNA-binding transcriptional MocR family regulator